LRNDHLTLVPSAVALQVHLVSQEAS
jgi:hypothetical protein